MAERHGPGKPQFLYAFAGIANGKGGAGDGMLTGQRRRVGGGNLPHSRFVTYHPRPRSRHLTFVAPGPAEAQETASWWFLLPRGKGWARVSLERNTFMNEVTRGGSEHALHDLGAAVREGEEMLNSTAAEVGEKNRALRAKLEAAVQKARVLYEQLEAKTVATAKAADQTVREHPYQAIGIAFVAGLLIGVLAVRNRRD